MADRKTKWRNSPVFAADKVAHYTFTWYALAGSPRIADHRESIVSNSKNPIPKYNPRFIGNCPWGNLIGVVPEDTAGECFTDAPDEYLTPSAEDAHIEEMRTPDFGRGPFLTLGNSKSPFMAVPSAPRYSIKGVSKKPLVFGLLRRSQPIEQTDTFIWKQAF
jgi:hypothetical protein